jgi:hypothetical protein
VIQKPGEKCGIGPSWTVAAQKKKCVYVKRCGWGARQTACIGVYSSKVYVITRYGVVP